MFTRRMRTRLTDPLIILCWRGCVKVRDRDAYEFFVRVEPNRDIIWSHDIGACCPVFSMAALPAVSACMMLPNYGDHGTTAFYTDAWGVGPGESASFPSKWLAADGQPAWLVFSGDDSFSIRRATLELVSDWQTTPDSAQARGQQLTIARFLPHYRIPGINGIRLNQMQR